MLLLLFWQSVREVASSCCSVENRGKTQPNNDIKNMKSIHYTLQVPGGYTRTHTHTRTHMETITKRRLKPFWKGTDNRTKQKPNIQNKTKRQKPLSLSVPASLCPSVVSLCPPLSLCPSVHRGGTHDVDNIVVHMSSFIVSGERGTCRTVASTLSTVYVAFKYPCKWVQWVA